MPLLQDLLTQDGGVGGPFPATPPQAEAAMPGFVRVIERLAKRIDSVQSEYGREIYRSVMEGALSQATDGLIRDIPDMETLALRRTQRDALRQQILAQDAQGRFDTAVASTFDIDPKIKARYQITDDQMLADPDKFLHFVNAEGLTEKPLTRGDLAMLPARYLEATMEKIGLLTPEGRARMAGEAAMKAQQQAMEAESSALGLVEKRAAHPGKMAEERAKTQEILSEAQQGGGIYGQMLDSGQQQVEQTTGTDLSSSFLGPDTDLDEPRGGLAVHQIYELMQGRIGQDLGHANVADLVLSRFKDDIKDQLEDVPLDENGEVMVGVPGGLLFGEEIGGDAQAMLMALLRRVAADKNVPLQDVLTQLEVPGKVSDQKAFDAALVRWMQDYAKRTNQDPKAVLKALGGG